MTRLTPRLALIAAFAAVAVGVLSAPAAALGRGPDVDAGTDPGGASVHVIERSIDGGSSTGGHGADDGCARRYIATTELVYKFPQARFDASFDLPPQPSAFHQAFDVYCGSTYIATVWAIPQAAAAVIGAELARELLARVEFPPARIAASPRRGLTGLESWFWIDGAGGAPIVLSRSEFGISVDLEVRLAGVTWSFGDGTRLDAGLGRTFPARSDVTHTYETRGRHTVTAAFRFTARYRVDGGAWVDLGPVPRTVTATYDVVEVRSLLVR
jgi:hypothetical protein